MNVTHNAFKPFRLLFILVVAMHLSACDRPQSAEKTQIAQVSAETKPMPKCKEAKAGGPEEVVRTIYRQYPFGSDKFLMNQPRNVLAKFFDERLTDLLVTDQKCHADELDAIRHSIKTNVACYTLLPVMNDPEASGPMTDLRVCAMDPREKTVKVQYRNYGDPIITTFKLSNTPAGWRISTIYWPASPDEDLPRTANDWDMAGALSLHYSR